ncbi:MAG: hypothetical protein WBG08_09590, partial [Litorimonas sp.]
ARLGFGVDEDTALVASGDALRVEGRGYVTVIDARTALLQRGTDGALRAEGVMLHLAGPGDRIDPETGVPTPADWRDATIANEYVRSARPSGGGMALPAETLSDVIGEALTDNADSRAVSRISFDGSGRGVRYGFVQTDASKGHWGRHPDTDDAHYTVTSVRFAVEPVDVAVRAQD